MVFIMWKRETRIYPSPSPCKCTFEFYLRMRILFKWAERERQNRKEIIIKFSLDSRVPFTDPGSHPPIVYRPVGDEFLRQFSRPGAGQLMEWVKQRGQQRRGKPVFHDQGPSSMGKCPFLQRVRIHTELNLYLLVSCISPWDS